MNKKTLAALAVLLLALVAVLLCLNLSESESPKAEGDLISGEDFQSEKLKLNEPDPSREDFKSIGDIGFDEKRPAPAK